uniref:Protein kinase domain-containing protein n=1 Tax=Haemonchus contortus TaxID=6289 RepID=A0A7I4YBF8_HAECO
MQVSLRIIVFPVFLLFGPIEALLSDGDCAAYHELLTTSDYENFVDDCAGKEVLGFECSSQDFNAGMLSEQMFNKLFVNARRISFHIYVQNTGFEHLALPNLEFLGGLTIRNNIRLQTFQVGAGFQFDRTQVGPTVVTVDGNKMLNSESMAGLRHLCPFCDIFEWSKCSALDPAEFMDYGKLVQQCAGERIIKTKPMKSMTLNLNMMTQEQFSTLFAEATHVQMTISMQDVSWTSLVFPKLLRLIPCTPGDRTLRIVRNSNLKIISFPAYNSEGFGQLNIMTNIEIRNNYVLQDQVIDSLKGSCHFCMLEKYRECNAIKASQASNAWTFVELCSGKRIWKPSPGETLELDISTLSQEIVTELFQEVTYIKMCIILRQSQIKYLRMPNLVEMYSCQPGKPAFMIEGNLNLEIIEVSTTFKWDISEEPFHIVYNPGLRQYPPLKQCKYCVFEPNTKCGATTSALSYTAFDQIMENCRGKPSIVYRETVVITEEQFTQLVSNAVYLEICFNITDTNYKSISSPRLRSVKPCAPGKQVWTIVNNPQLEVIDIPVTVVYPVKERIMVVKGNPMVPLSVIMPLRKICPHCTIEFSPRCDSIKAIQLSDASNFVGTCGVRKIWKPSPGETLEFDISTLSQELIIKLFQEVTYIKMCITLRQSQIKYLRMPKLVELHSCQPGTPAFIIEGNPNLEVIEVSSAFKWDTTEEIFHIVYNPRLRQYPPVEQQCKYCVFEPNTKCGAMTLSLAYTALDEIIQYCPGKRSIVYRETAVITQDQFNQLCSNAIYLQVCFNITNTNFVSINCPRLLSVKPCAPGKQVWTIVNNPYLEIINIPVTVVYPVMERIMIVKGNPLVPLSIIGTLKKICPHCMIEFTPNCGALKALQTNNVQGFVELCATQKIWKPSAGETIELDISTLSQELVIKLFQEVTYIKMCITLRQSQIKYLRMPNLVEMYSCQPGKPAFLIEGNPNLETIEVATTFKWDISEESFHIVYNPGLRQYPPVEQCKYCVFEPKTKCGATTTSLSYPTFDQIMQTCPGKRSIVFHETVVVTQEQFNQLCYNAVYLQICFDVTDTDYQSINCPRLRLVKPCVPGKQVWTIVNNPQLEIIDIPVTVIYPITERIMVVKGNPLIPSSVIQQLKKICPQCAIEESSQKRCALKSRRYSDKELARLCAGSEIITPQKGYYLTVSSSYVTEEEMNNLFAKATFVEICITVHESEFTRLRFPHLREIRSCLPGRPAIEIIGNLKLKELFIMNTIRFPKNELIFEISENPNLPITVINQLKVICPGCKITANLDCELQSPTYTNQQLVTACAGKRIIRPSEGHMLVFNSPTISEAEMNALCSKAIYMEVCIDITNSRYVALRCPHLKELLPCQPGRPAIRIVENLFLETLVIPWNFIYPTGELILEISENPRLPLVIINQLKKLCPGCKITANLGCGLKKRDYSTSELVAACAGKKIIKPAVGYMLVLYSDSVTEQGLNALCSKAVHMEICITITHSQFKHLSCPNLQELRPCLPGSPAIKVVNNDIFQNLLIPSTTIYPEGDLIIEVKGNPQIPQTQINALKQWCKQCIIVADDTTRMRGGQVHAPGASQRQRCSLEARHYTSNELVRLCTGKEVIQPQKGFPLIISSSEVTETEMNKLFSNVVVMEICISIVNSDFKSLRFPRLQEIRPCLPGRPAITIVDNIWLKELVIPFTVRFPPNVLIFEIAENPNLPITIINFLKQKCQQCHITANLGCGLQSHTYTDREIALACAGKKIIRPLKGSIIHVKSSTITEGEMNALCSKAVFMEICIDISNSQYRALRCPYLKQLLPCHQGRPAIRIVENLFMETLVIPWNFAFPQGELILEISENPRLSLIIINQLRRLCPGCRITANLGCGLKKRGYSTTELVAACAGKRIIKPAEGYMLVLNSNAVTEHQLNALCSKAVHMEICITITNSQFKQFYCPYLQELRPCLPGSPAIKIVNNILFEHLHIPPTTIYPEGDLIIEISGNPKLSPNQIYALKQWCTQCTITSGSNTHSLAQRRCKLEARWYKGKEIVQICAGAQIIKPHKGFPLMVSSTEVTETEINNLCSNAVFMEICIVIANSDFTRLRCPHLQEIRPCLPERPAIKLVGNLFFKELFIPMTVRYPEKAYIFEINENPLLSLRIIEWLRVKCKHCVITANLGCDLQSRTYTEKQLVAACAGKRIIRPAAGYVLMLSSTTTTEEEMNAMCSKAVYMEICIDITRSQYTALRCPYLKVLKACMPGKPAIRIVDNYRFQVFEIPASLRFPVSQQIIEFSGNPLMSITIITQLKKMCPHCRISANLGCGLTKRDYTTDELVNACAGKKIIRPAQGYMLVIDSRVVTEAQLNALCSRAVYMEICINVFQSPIQQISCPHLRVLKPCMPNKLALRVVNNNALTNIVLSDSLRLSKSIEVRGNQLLSAESRRKLKLICPACVIR